MKRVYAVVSGDGQFIDASESMEKAAASANRAGFENVFLDKTYSDDGESMTPNAMSPEQAHRMMGSLYIDYDAAMRMSLEEAASRALPWMPAKKVSKTAMQKLDRSPAGLVERIIGKNYKTSKTGEEYLGFSVYVEGLSLLPHSLWWDSLDKATEVPALPVLQGGRVLMKEPSVGKKLTLCAGSSPECRESCLVYSGQNMNDVFSTVSKMSWTNFFMYEPVAFMRILGEKVHRNLRSRSSSLQFVRLNVLSDVPWEMVCPGLIESMQDYEDSREYPPLYDYTKVPGRTPGGLYDLTFSFSGRNAHSCIEEALERDRRIAVVYIDSENRPGQDYAKHPRYQEIQRKRAIARKEAARLKVELGLGKGKSAIPYLPDELQEDYETGSMLGTRRPFTLPASTIISSDKTEYEFEVIDGDIHDARPLDPRVCIVGLKYKAPKQASQQTRGRVGAGVSAKGGMTAAQLRRFQKGYGREYERISGMDLGRKFSMEEMYERERTDAFLVPAFETRDGALITAVVPRHESDFTPGSDDVPDGFSSEGAGNL